MRSTDQAGIWRNFKLVKLNILFFMQRGERANLALLIRAKQVAFSYPVVAPDRARIRTQMSAAFNREDLEFALAGFARVKQQLGL